METTTTTASPAPLKPRKTEFEFIERDDFFHAQLLAAEALPVFSSEVNLFIKAVKQLIAALARAEVYMAPETREKDNEVAKAYYRRCVAFCKRESPPDFTEFRRRFIDPYLQEANLENINLICLLTPYALRTPKKRTFSYTLITVTSIRDLSARACSNVAKLNAMFSQRYLDASGNYLPGWDLPAALTGLKAWLWLQKGAGRRSTADVIAQMNILAHGSGAMAIAATAAAAHSRGDGENEEEEAHAQDNSAAAAAAAAAGEDEIAELAPGKLPDLDWYFPDGWFAFVFYGKPGVMEWNLNPPPMFTLEVSEVPKPNSTQSRSASKKARVAREEVVVLDEEHAATEEIEERALPVATTTTTTAAASATSATPQTTVQTYLEQAKLETEARIFETESRNLAVLLQHAPTEELKKEIFDRLFAVTRRMSKS